MTMVRVHRSTVIDAPVAAVWEIVRDFNGHDRWHPAVRTSQTERGYLTDQVGCIRNFVLTGGERIREQLLTLSDKERSLRYTIVESDVPLMNYVAEIVLKPITDGARTFWSWSSRFDTPPGQETALGSLVAEAVYEAGFESIRERLKDRWAPSSPPSGSSKTSAAFTRSITSALPAESKALSGQAMGIQRYGGPDELQPIEVHADAPGPGEVRLRHSAIGVNFIDVYCRTGYFKLLQPPGVPGMEAVGVVDEVGSGVTHVKVGQRVAYACPPVGAYASVRTLSAELVVPVPDTLDDQTVAAGLLKGMSAQFLVKTVHKVQAGENVLVYAPAGGVGQLLCQWAAHLGARVIGATSSEEKARIARASGASDVILPGAHSLEDQVMALTEGQGADVIYDAVGRDSFAHSVAALANCGHLVSFGQASGDIGSWDIGSLASKSSTVSRPNFGHYTDTPEKVSTITSDLFRMIETGTLRIAPPRTFPLTAAADAHRALEGRATTGSTILIP